MKRPLSAMFLALGTSMLCAQQDATTASPPPNVDAALQLRYERFDPLLGVPAVPPALRSAGDTRLWIVQLRSAPTDAMRAAIRATGAELFGYLPDHAYVVRAGIGVAATVRALIDVRWIGAYEPAYRLEPALLAEHRVGVVPPVRNYNLIVVDRLRDKPRLAADIAAIGGTVVDELGGSILVEVQLNAVQLLQVARLDTVLWIDRSSPIEFDMDNARVQGGADYVESVAGYTGTGINGHVYEGVQTDHPDFNTPPVAVLSCASAAAHGHCTAGIIFGNGTSNPGGRGLIPDATPFFTNTSCSSQSRYDTVQELVQNRDVSFTTASWGNARTFSYNSISADADQIVFDHDIVWTQSQSNAGFADSRPQAWAKNLMSIGGVRHGNNSDPSDDSWFNSGSTGPADDGRLKPDLSAYYDSILCSDLTGSDGYNRNGDFFTSFGGTSGATPIVAGHNGIAIQMFTDARFGNTLRNPGGSRFSNRAHAATHKALMIASARQYAFNASSIDNRREQVGWGFPDLRAMWDGRSETFIVDETDLLTQGQTARYVIRVGSGANELKATLVFTDPAANPAAALARVNDLSLRVTAPNGVVYHGNHGLRNGNYSPAGGTLDTVDTVECVFVQFPAAGDWFVDVIATLVAADGHVETGATDADFGLVVRGGTRVDGDSTGGTLRNYGQGCAGTATGDDQPCETRNARGTYTYTSSGEDSNTTYAFELTAGSAFSMTAFEFFGRTRSGSDETLTATVHLPAGGGEPGPAIATTTVTVRNFAGWNRATLATPIAINAGQTFFVAYRNGGTGIRQHRFSGTGTVVPYYKRDTGNWSGRIADGSSEWALRVFCPGQVLPPRASAGGTPDLGRSFETRLADALPNTPVAMLLGFSDTQWAGGSLPAPLDVFGAPGCLLLTSIDASVPLRTDANGFASTTTAIPNRPELFGLDVFQQFAVQDIAANQLGIVFSDAIAIQIGG